MYFFSKKEQQHNCLICLEPILNDVILPVRFQCKCKPHIHLLCFEDWQNHSHNKCPICLKKVKNKVPFSYLNGFQVIFNFVCIIIAISVWYSFFLHLYNHYFYSLDHEL